MPKPPKNILLASVLKPVNDTRLYAKIGQSLAEIFPEAHLHFVAYPASKAFVPPSKKYHFHPFKPFKRLSFRRVLCNFYLLKQLFKIRPKLLIVSTFELLPSALLYACICWSCRLVYDVRENYADNLRYSTNFPRLVGWLLSFLVSAAERIAAWRIDAYWLAERCYADELQFTRQKAIILENKSLRKQMPNPVLDLKKDKLTLCYTGTISADYGIFKLLDWYQTLKPHFPNLALKIVGFAAAENTQKRLRKRLENLPEVALIGGEKLVAHQELLQHLAQADVAVLPYELTKNIRRRLPTKFYECLHLRRPILIQQHQFWEDFLSEFPFQAAQFIDFDKPETSQIEELKRAIRDKHFYQKVPPQAFLDIYWEGQIAQLKKHLAQL